MTTKAPLEQLLRETLDRLSRQEVRMEALEASIFGTARSSATRPFASATETPPEIGWPPKRELPSRSPAPPEPDKAKQMDARLLEAEERLRCAARLETLGRLVASVAHDFNNLLTVIAGYADTICTALPAGHHLRETADLIASTSLTAAGISRQLVAFGKPSKPEFCPIDVNLAIRNVEKTLRRFTGERIVLEFLPASTLPLVRADPSQFDQVLLNLVVNGRDATPGDGTITISTATEPVVSDRAGWPAEVPTGEFVAVTVSDTGLGMTADVVERIFDPFFTTKGERGTGLGLATVRDIVRGAGGHIEVESMAGWGTSVRVFWPIFPEHPEPNSLRLMR
jgi:signal transduction histidine kinase